MIGLSFIPQGPWTKLVLLTAPFEMSLTTKVSGTYFILAQKQLGYWMWFYHKGLDCRLYWSDPRSSVVCGRQLAAGQSLLWTLKHLQRPDSQTFLCLIQMFYRNPTALRHMWIRPRQIILKSSLVIVVVAGIKINSWLYYVSEMKYKPQACQQILTGWRHWI